MPYITKERRLELEDTDPGLNVKTAGELNYVLASIIDDYFYNSCYSVAVSYQTFNDVVGVLENLKFEIQRRFLAPYEDQKIEENGEVFWALKKDGSVDREECDNGC